MLSRRVNLRLRAAPGLPVRADAGRGLHRACSARPSSVPLFVPLYLLAYVSMGLTDPMHFELLNDAVGATARATLISAEALATQGGALVANLGVGALAADTRHRARVGAGRNVPGGDDARRGAAALPNRAHGAGLIGIHPHLPSARR